MLRLTGMMNARPTNAKETLSAAYGPPGGGGGFGAGGPPGFGSGGGGYGGGYGGAPAGPPGFGPPGGFPPPGGPITPGGQPEANTTLPLLLNAANALCCFWGVVSFPVAIVGVVFSVQAMKAQKAGDRQVAGAKAKLAMILAVVSYGLAAIAAVIHWISWFARAVFNS